MAVRNPLGQESWILDVVWVSPPDAGLMITIRAVQGEVQISLDWPVEIYTAEAAALEASMLMDEEDLGNESLGHIRNEVLDGWRVPRR